MSAGRYFYADPLAAAWMVKKFGMKFERGDGDLILDFFDMVDDLAGHIAMDDWTGRYYVHPESLHLLEPTQGDLVEYMGLLGGFGIGTVTDAPYEGDDGEMVFCIDDADSFPVENLHRIIQRNGIAFHWPESEGA